jgi:hypothetical protein
MNTQQNSNKASTKRIVKKKKISFSTQEVFDVGFKPDVEASFCIVAKMLFRNVINIDGSVDMEQLVNVKKKELWAYIYYLYQYNNSTIPEFIKMKNPLSGRADGQAFHDTVYIEKEFNSTNFHKTVGTDIVRLVYFINKMVHTYKNDLINPVIDYLKQLMKKEMLTKLSEIKVQMVPKLNSGKHNVKVGVQLLE